MIKTKNFLIDEIIVVTNSEQRFLVLEQIEALNIKISIRIILEPEPKNTAPALTLAALDLVERSNTGVMVVTPSDHYIGDIKRFANTIQSAIMNEKNNSIITIGINPTKPETGYGYIEIEGHNILRDVKSFKEKPSFDNAKEMIKSNNFQWNSGIFLMRPNTWLNSIKLSSRDLYKYVSESWQKKTEDQWFIRPCSELFSKSISISIDYAVMEKAKELPIKLYSVLLDSGWSDLGSFNSIYNIEKKDINKNVFKGVVYDINTYNCLAVSTKKNISLLGVSNLIIIETDDSVLVANREDSNAIKDLVKIIAKKNKHLLIEHKRVIRPWGWFEIIDEGSNYKVKRLFVKPNGKLSYQSHKYRNEHWVVIKGQASIIRDDDKFTLSKDQSTYISKNVKHQLMNLKNENLEIIEVQTGKKLLENDIKRYADVYGRVDLP